MDARAAEAATAAAPAAPPPPPSAAGDGPLTVGVMGSGPGAGKDAFAAFVLEALSDAGLAPESVAFAAPLRRVLAVLTGASAAECATTAGKARKPAGFDGATVGRLHQVVGDGLRGLLDDGVWIRAAFRGVAPRQLAVVTDVRYENEAAFVRGRRGVVVRIVRPPRGARAEAASLAGRDPAHASEAFAGPVDEVVRNDGDLAALRAKARAFVRARFPGARLPEAQGP